MPSIQLRLPYVCQYSNGPSSANIRAVSRCTRFIMWRLKLLHSCILQRRKSTIQRQCRRSRMRTAPIISLTVATTISAISTQSLYRHLLRRQGEDQCPIQAGNGDFPRTWFLMQLATSRFIKVRRITLRNCERWYV